MVSETLRSSISALEGRDPLISGLVSKPGNSCSTTRVISVSPSFRTPGLEAGGRPKMPFEVGSKNELDVVFRVDRRNRDTKMLSTGRFPIGPAVMSMETAMLYTANPKLMSPWNHPLSYTRSLKIALTMAFIGKGTVDVVACGGV